MASSRVIFAKIKCSLCNMRDEWTEHTAFSFKEDGRLVLTINDVTKLKLKALGDHDRNLAKLWFEEAGVPSQAPHGWQVLCGTNVDAAPAVSIGHFFIIEQRLCYVVVNNDGQVVLSLNNLKQQQFVTDLAYKLVDANGSIRRKEQPARDRSQVAAARDSLRQDITKNASRVAILSEDRLMVLPGNVGRAVGGVLCMYHTLEPWILFGRWICRSLYMNIAYEKVRVYDDKDCAVVFRAVQKLRDENAKATEVLLHGVHAPSHPLPGVFTVQEAGCRVDFLVSILDQSKYLYAVMYRNV